MKQIDIESLTKEAIYEIRKNMPFFPFPKILNIISKIDNLYREGKINLSTMDEEDIKITIKRIVTNNV